MSPPFSIENTLKKAIVGVYMENDDSMTDMGVGDKNESLARVLIILSFCVDQEASLTDARNWCLSRRCDCATTRPLMPLACCVCISHSADTLQSLSLEW